MPTIDKKRVFWRENDEEVVLLNVESGDYYSLNPLGAFIWKLIVEGLDESQIVNRIVTEYDVEPTQASKDLAELIKEFRKEKFLE